MHSSSKPNEHVSYSHRSRSISSTSAHSAFTAVRLVFVASHACSGVVGHPLIEYLSTSHTRSTAK